MKQETRPNRFPRWRSQKLFLWAKPIVDSVERVELRHEEWCVTASRGSEVFLLRSMLSEYQARDLSRIILRARPAEDAAWEISARPKAEAARELRSLG